MATDGRKTRGIRPVPDRLQDEALRPFLEDVERLSRLFRQVADNPTLLAISTSAGTGTPVPGPVGPPGPPAPGTTPDLTPPPIPTGLAAAAGFANIFIQWDVAVYTQGRGNLQTNIYGAKYPGAGPLPTFTDAVLVGVAPQPDNIFILPTELGTQWHIWITFQSKDGVESVTPAGGANGAQAATGRIGNADLGPLVVQAANLAEGAIDLTTNKVKADASFGAIAVGYTVTQYLLATSGVMANLIVDNAQIASLAAGKITAGSLGVGSYIQSNDYISGVSGWRISGSGFAELAAAAIRGQLTAAQIAAWSISAGRAIIADGTISNAKIESLTANKITAGNIQAGGYIRSTTYTPGSAGWSINSDGTAEFSAASVRGKLSAGNILGSAANYAYGATTLTLSGGWVANQLLTQGNYLQLEGTGAPLEDAIVEGEFHGYITMDMKPVFAGGSQNYRASIICRPRLELWNGSSWVAPLSDGPFTYIAHPILLTGSEQYSWPITLKYPSQSILLSSWTRARMVAVIQQVAINQLAVNGGAIKSDCINTVQIVGTFSLRQFPN